MSIRTADDACRKKEKEIEQSNLKVTFCQTTPKCGSVVAPTLAIKIQI